VKAVAFADTGESRPRAAESFTAEYSRTWVKQKEGKMSHKVGICPGNGEER